MNDINTQWQQYIGRSVSHEAQIDAAIVARFDGALCLRHWGDALPLGIHWCVGVQTVATNLLGPDGHPPKGNFLPPVTLPRRMWAGGAMEVLAPLHLGQSLRRTSRIVDISEKTGRSGSLVFVTLTHEIEADGVLAIKERQDIVYRPADNGPKAAPLPTASVPSEGREWVMPSTPLLFRYSALTFNSHRIHYDLPYAQTAENYPALVVHGPLQATLLADAAARRFGRPLSGFSFKGQAPAFADIPLELEGYVDEQGEMKIESRQFSKPCMVAVAR